MFEMSCSGKDIINGKVRPSDIRQQYYIVKEKDIDKLSEVINIMCENGWAINFIWYVGGGAYRDSYVLFERGGISDITRGGL